MNASYGKNSGYRAVSSGELMLVNGGRWTDHDVDYTGPGYHKPSQNDGASLVTSNVFGINVPSGVQINDGSNTVVVSVDRGPSVHAEVTHRK